MTRTTTRRRVFTFQYVSILIYFVNHSFIINLFIYIPICFYFNKKCKKLLIISTKSFTFQYVSILIIVAVLFPIFCKNIYIPICFYFNSKGTTEYSIGARKFTFQYVSILIAVNTLTIAVIILFTFQYVSILIISLRIVDKVCKHLHSNMFLF